MTRVILASGSPRRQHLLTMLGIEHEVIPSEFDEYAFDPNEFPSRETYVEAIAMGKILEVVGRVAITEDPLVVLGGDLVTYIEDKTFHKPTSYEQALEYMRQFADVWHDEVVASGVWTPQDGLRLSTVTSKVFTPELSEAQLKDYLNIASPLDKSGGYSVGAIARVLGRHPTSPVLVEGSVSGVLGFPVEVVAELLRHAGIPVSVDEQKLEAQIRQEILFPYAKN